jgi:oligoendopeptidase F
MVEKRLEWNLNDLVKNEKGFHELLKEVEGSIPKIRQDFKKLSPNMKESDFKKIIDFNEKLSEKASRLGVYVALLSEQNSKSQQVMKLQPLLKNLSVILSDETRSMGHWMQGLAVKGKQNLDKKNAKRLFKTLPIHEYNLLRDYNLSKHTLSEEVEKVIHRKDINGTNVISELYDKITTDFSFKYKPKGKKEIVYHNVEELKKHIYSANDEERKAAYEALFEPYKNQKEVLFTIYSSLVRDWGVEKELRQYETPINVRNVDNDLTDEVINTLIKVCVQNKKIYQDFFKLKAKALGKKKLNRTDFYAPLKKSKKKYSFEEGKKIVFDVYNNFHPEFAKKAEFLFKEGHIDSHPRKNKGTGAFCISVSGGITPYVMLNHTETLRDVSTIAHELGHAIHDIYTHDLPQSVSHAAVPLCETASTFCELLLAEALFKKVGKEEKKEMLMGKLSDSYASILRQIYFVKFEMEAHDKIPHGVTDEELSEMWMRNLKEQFGNSVEVPEMFKYEWAYIPHLYHHIFYCYGYSFGELLSLALYAKYKEEGKKFIPKLERILSAGGSINPEKLLKKEGFDITKPEFWQGGFDVINSWLKELKKL